MGVSGEISHLLFFSSTSVYQIPAVLGTGDTKIKLGVVPEKIDN